MEFFIDGKRARSDLSYPGKEVWRRVQALRLRGIRTNLTIIIEDSQYLSIRNKLNNSLKRKNLILIELI